jgi:hypothetical protein
VNVFSHGSSFFMLIAPVRVSIVDLVKREHGNRALHLPHLLSLQPEDVLFFSGAVFVQIMVTTMNIRFKQKVINCVCDICPPI